MMRFDQKDHEAFTGIEMPKYVSHKQIWALEIAGITQEHEVNTYRLSFAEDVDSIYSV